MIFPPAYEGSEPYIFVSYAHSDSDRVLPVISALQERGFRIWYDAGIEAGTEWPEYIAQYLNDCNSFVAFMSCHAANSHNCRREINFAIKLRKEPLVIYLEDVELSLGMQMQLDSLQAIYRTRHSDDDSFLTELCRSRLLSPCRGETPQQESAQKLLSDFDTDPKVLFRLGEEARERSEITTAIECYFKAADLGSPEAQVMLGECYSVGAGYLPKDKEIAVEWYRKAARQGHPDAEMVLRYLGRDW
ncbi:MAG: toll/interleukin-1 receptor domain-containing protein [Oscillospiraceae bacterium]|nr:toll/interleukin-1 receptor domain-containing protein [Oscillospiraceae bacterium]